MSTSSDATTDKEISAFVDVLRADTTDQAASLEELFTTAYEELHRLAHAQRSRWSGQETMSTTVLIHEAYLKLSQQDALQSRDRGHFFRVASQAMRHILINYAKSSQRAKRGGTSTHVPLEEASVIANGKPKIENLLALDEALTRLERQNPRWAQVLECRIFAGLDVEETAEALEISPTTVKRDWQRGQAWIFGMMKDAR